MSASASAARPILSAITLDNPPPQRSLGMQFEELLRHIIRGLPTSGVNAPGYRVLNIADTALLVHAALSGLLKVRSHTPSIADDAPANSVELQYKCPRTVLLELATVCQPRPSRRQRKIGPIAVAAVVLSRAKFRNQPAQLVLREMRSNAVFPLIRRLPGTEKVRREIFDDAQTLAREHIGVAGRQRAHEFH